MASHYVDTGHEFDLVEANILSHANMWTAGWPSNKTHIIFFLLGLIAF